MCTCEEITEKGRKRATTTMGEIATGCRMGLVGLWVVVVSEESEREKMLGERESVCVRTWAWGEDMCGGGGVWGESHEISAVVVVVVFEKKKIEKKNEKNILIFTLVLFCLKNEKRSGKTRKRGYLPTRCIWCNGSIIIGVIVIGGGSSCCCSSCCRSSVGGGSSRSSGDICWGSSSSHLRSSVGGGSIIIIRSNTGCILQCLIACGLWCFTIHWCCCSGIGGLPSSQVLVAACTAHTRCAECTRGGWLKVPRVLGVLCVIRLLIAL